MSAEEFNALSRGDVVKNVKSGRSYRVTTANGSGTVRVKPDRGPRRFVDQKNAARWEISKPKAWGFLE